MIDRISQIAEHAATNVSRRAFLGRLGRTAMLLAAAAGGLLTTSAQAQAAPRVCQNAASDVACWNRKVGDFCLDGQGHSGKCRAVRGTTACHCR
jgi:hypothetical protein